MGTLFDFSFCSFVGHENTDNELWGIPASDLKGQTSGVVLPKWSHFYSFWVVVIDKGEEMVQ